jgi:hypothetical protein
MGAVDQSTRVIPANAGHIGATDDQDAVTRADRDEPARNGRNRPPPKAA